MIQKDRDYCYFSNGEVSKIEGTIEKIGELHNAMEDLKHLQTLPVIAENLRSLNDNIIGPAMGKKVVPQAAYFTTLVIMGLIIGVLLLKDSDKSLSIDSGGFHMGELKPGEHDSSASQ